MVNRAVCHYRLAGCLVEVGRATIVDSINLVMARVLDRVHGVAMHSMTAASVRIIIDAVTVEALLFSPDGDPLGTVAITKDEAVRLVSLPVMLGHVFRATDPEDQRCQVSWSVLRGV